MATAPLQARLLARVDGGELAIPSLPQAAVEAMRELDRPEPRPRQLASILSTDAGFTAEVLRVASSALFGGGAPIVSLPQAITRLGLQRIKELAILVAARSRLALPGVLAQPIRALLRHSLATAIVANEIARQRRARVEESFLAGLLHDLGRLVLLTALRDELGDRPPPSAAELFALTDELHGRVGALLVERWGLGRAIRDAVGAHHAPRADELAAVVALADRIAHELLGDAVLPPDAPKVAAALDLYPEDLEEIVARAGDLASTVAVIS